MYVSEISNRFSRGMSTPEIRAIVLLALTLLVARVDADDPHRAVPTDHLALVAHLLYRRTNLHETSFAGGGRLRNGSGATVLERTGVGSEKAGTTCSGR